MRALGINRPSSDPWLPLSFLSPQLGGGGLWPSQEGSSLAAPSPSLSCWKPGLLSFLSLNPSTWHPSPASLFPCPWSPAFLSPFLAHSAALAHFLCLMRPRSCAGTSPVKTSEPPATPAVAQPSPTPISAGTQSSVLQPRGAQAGGVPLEARWLSKHWGWSLLAEARLRVHKFRTGVFPGPQPTAGGGRRPRPPASPAGFLAAGCSWLPRSISSVRTPAPPTPPLHSPDCHVPSLASQAACSDT